MRTSFLTMSLALLASVSARAQQDAPVAPPPAQAAPVPQGNPHLAAAQRLYQKLDLDAALAELQQAEQGASEDDTVQVLIYRGLIYSDQGRGNDATDQFKRALAMRPWAEVPPETSPRVSKNFSEARKSIWGVSVKPPKKRASASATPTPSPGNAPASPPPDAPAPQIAPASGPNDYQPPPK